LRTSSTPGWAERAIRQDRDEGCDDSRRRTQLLAQTLVGSIDTVGGRKLSFALMVNDVPLPELGEILEVFSDQGTMTAVLQQAL
jgi:hypothetical protein